MKRKNMIRTLAISLIALLAVPITLAYAYPRDDHDDEYGSREKNGYEEDRSYREERGEGGRSEHRKKEAIGNLVEELGLSEEQVEELTALKESHRDTQKQLHESLKEANNNLRKELESPEVSKSVWKVAEEVKGIQAQMVDSRIEHILAVKEILTPEQFEKFQEKFFEMKERRGEKMKRRTRERSGEDDSSSGRRDKRYKEEY
ncbi:MAG: Spy/CpxP family protein refolding chaperone [Candidatus Omnitrophica bacterium]|nr:Spy/CpxP family protein refolding chaperone [Candidatus Omnitrophota bacterium]